jgi:hypothetical protein
MTTLISPAIDEAQVKATARTIQKRLNELGGSVSLGHALEAAAAAFGYANWPTLQGILAKRQSLAPAKPLNNNMDDLIPQFDGNRKLLAVIGEGPNRRPVFSAIVEQAVKLYRQSHPELLTYSVDVVDFDSKIKGAAVGRAQSTKDEIVFCLGLEGSTFNIFQTPFGVRVPKPSWFRSEAVLTALYGLLIEDDHFWERVIIAHAAEETYERFADGTLPDSLVRAYQKGVDPKIDAVLNGVVPQTWWDVSDLLAGRGHDDLAVRAHAIACPRLEDFARQLRVMKFENVWKHGLPSSIDDAKAEKSRATLVDRAERLISECPFLNRVSSVRLKGDTAVAVRCLVDQSANAYVQKAQYLLGMAFCAHHWSAATEEFPDSPPKAVTILGKIETVFLEDQVSMVPRHLMHRLAPFYKNVREAHVLFIEGEDVLTMPFKDSKEARTFLLTGEYRENANDRNLEIVKKLNLGHSDWELLNHLPSREGSEVGLFGILDRPNKEIVNISV